MIKMLTWLTLLAVVVVYLIVTSLFTFEGPIALSIHFSRIALTVAGTIVYVRKLPDLFDEIPTPRRDYLIAGVIFFFLSAVCFSVWNEAGRVFGVDPSIFTSPIAGLFSLFLVVASTFVLIAPDQRVREIRIAALIIGAVVSVGLVFIAPLFR